MNAGVPGTGLGGLFYIVSALLMPFHRLRRGGGHSGRTWRRALAQAGIGLGILAALAATGWVLGLAIASDGALTAAGGQTRAAAIPMLRWVAVLGTVGLLAILLLVVEVLGAVFVRRSRVGNAAPFPSAPSPSDPDRVAAEARAARAGRAEARAPDEDLPRVA